MWNIINMLLYFPDPTGLIQYECYQLDTSLSLQQNIKTYFPNGFDYTVTDVIFNGIIIDPLTYCLSRKANIFDDIRIINRQQGIEIGLGIGLIIAAFFAVAAYALTPRPRIPNAIGEQKDSSNNKLTGQTNIARLYQAKPNIYGCIRCYPDLVKPAGSEYIDNIKYVDHLMCIGIGQYQLDNFKYSQTLLNNMSDTNYKVYEHGSIIEKVRYEYASDEVDGQELTPPNLDDLETINRDYGGYEKIEIDNDKWNITLKKDAKVDDLENLKLPVNMDFTRKQDLEYYRSIRPSGWYKGSRNETLSSVLYRIEKDAEERPILMLRDVKHISYNPDYNSVRNIVDNNSVFMITVNPFKYVGPFTLPEKGNEIQIDLAFLRGLRRSVRIRYVYYKIDENGNEIIGTRIEKEETINENTYASIYKSIKITELDESMYAIHLGRIDDGNSDLSDQCKVENIFICSYQENFKVNDTLIYIRTKATEQATSLKELKFNVEATRKTISYNRNTKEINFNLIPSRSFADAVLHEYVYVFGRNANELDLDALYEIDEKLKLVNPKLGYFDFSFDDSDMSFGQRIEAICNAARVMTYRDGQKWRFVRNEKKTRPVALFNSLNLVNSNDGGIIQKKSSLPSSYDSVHLEYVDATKDNQSGTDKKAYINLKIDENNAIVNGIGYRQNKIQLAGCRNRDQAMNRAHLEIRQLLYQRTIVEDEAMQDANFINKGDLVLWSDTWDNSVIQGEIIKIDGNKFYVDQNLSLEISKEYRVAITDKEGYPSSWLKIISFDGNSFTADFNKAYTADNNNVQMGSIFIITETISEEPTEFLLTNKTYNEGNYKISLVNYTDLLYEYDERIP